MAPQLRHAPLRGRPRARPATRRGRSRATGLRRRRGACGAGAGARALPLVLRAAVALGPRRGTRRERGGHWAQQGAQRGGPALGAGAPLGGWRWGARGHCRGARQPCPDGCARHHLPGCSALCCCCTKARCAQLACCTASLQFFLAQGGERPPSAGTSPFSTGTQMPCLLRTPSGFRNHGPREGTGCSPVYTCHVLDAPATAQASTCAHAGCDADAPSEPHSWVATSRAARRQPSAQHTCSAGRQGS